MAIVSFDAVGPQLSQDTPWNIWFSYVTDSIDTVEADGYFDSRIDQLADGDSIVVWCIYAAALPICRIYDVSISGDTVITYIRENNPSREVIELFSCLNRLISNSSAVSTLSQRVGNLESWIETNPVVVPGQVQFEFSSIDINEGGSTLVKLIRSGTSGIVTCDLNITGMTVTTEYTSTVASGATVSFSAGELEKLIVFASPAASLSGNKSAVLSISNFAYNGTPDATIAGGRTTCTVNVTNINDAPDTTPTAFDGTFTSKTDQPVGSYVQATETLTVSGINAATAISIANNGGQYRINGGAWTSGSGNVYNGDRVDVRMVSSASFSTALSTTLTIGGVTGTFSVTTVAQDTTPNQFYFTDVTDATTSTVYTSNAVTISGINSAATVTITGGTYSINGGAYTSNAGTANNGDSITVRHTSSGSNSTATNTTLTVGGVSDTYTTTTVAASVTNLFDANVNAVTLTQVSALSLDAFNFGATWNGVGDNGFGTPQNPDGTTPATVTPAAYYQGIENIAPDGGDVAQITCRAGVKQYNFGWDDTTSRASIGYGGTLFIRFKFRLKDGFRTGAAGSQFENKLVDILAGAVGTNRFIAHNYGRIGASDVRNLNSTNNANSLATAYGFASDTFSNGDYMALTMRQDDAGVPITNPIPLTDNTWYYVQMEIKNSSSAGVADGHFKIYVNTGDSTGAAGNKFYAERTGFAHLTANNAVHFGAYVTENNTNNSNIYQWADMQVGTSFDPNYCPWAKFEATTKAAYRLPFSWDFQSGGFGEFDGSVSNTGLSVVTEAGSVNGFTTTAFSGRRSAAFTLNASSGNDNYTEFYFGDHPLRPGGGVSAVNECWLTFPVKFSLNYDWPNTSTQKIAMLNLCDITTPTGTRRYQAMLYVTPSGYLAIARVRFNASGSYVDDIPYVSTYLMPTNEWVKIQVRVKMNTIVGGVAQSDGVFQVRVTDSGSEASTLEIDEQAVIVRENNTNVSINKFLFSSYAAHANGGAGVMWVGAGKLCYYDPGVND